ncbi:MAG: NTP transferase domain-containing protein [Tetrasphaera sp.]|jgi:mannose-1-phosphate guanylyltransferase|nr:NTP transferase domain-containing protein [Tetrasphaera sp.]
MSRATCAVVLAGGLGTRMAPLTANRPKHLLEVAGEPFAAHQLRWLAAHGVTDVVLATAYRAELFRPALGDGAAYGVRVRYAVEPAPLGTGGGVAHAARSLPGGPGEEPIVVVNGDLFTTHDVRAQLAVLDAHPDAEVCLHVRTVPDAAAYGCVVADDDGRVRAFLEKSPDPPTREVNAGTYAVRRRALDAIPGGVVSLERDIFPGLVAAGRVVAYREQTDWIDVGNPAALVAVSALLAARGHGAAWVAADATVDSSARVSGGSSVCSRARIEAGAVVVGSVVMPGAVVEERAEVHDSVVGPGARVAAGARLDGAAIGDGATGPGLTLPRE